MTLRRWLAAAASVALVSAGLVMSGASPASAADSDQIWYQSVGSPSQEAPCPESDPADLAQGWTPWAKGYEEWPNDGKGGWTCGRSILWAKGSPPPSSGDYPSTGCTYIGDGPYGQFNGTYYLSKDAPVYDDASCTGGTSGWTRDMVYAPAGWDATTLCLQAWGSAANLQNYGADVWGCKF